MQNKLCWAVIATCALIVAMDIASTPKKKKVTFSNVDSVVYI